MTGATQKQLFDRLERLGVRIYRSCKFESPPEYEQAEMWDKDRWGVYLAQNCRCDTHRTVLELGFVSQV